MFALSHRILLGLWCCVSLLACFEPDFHRECVQNSDCRQGQVCRFSNCVIPGLEGGEGDPVACPVGEIRCGGQCLRCPAQRNADFLGCSNGQCAYRCQAHFVDANMNLGLGEGFDGCECAPDGPEVCDGRDNDCDGVTDEGTATELCPQRPHASLNGCTNEQCHYRCEPNTFDLNQDLLTSGSDGCECVRSQSGLEICDGLDNDCDGQIDEGASLDNCPQVAGASAVACDSLTGACRYQCQVGLSDLNQDLALLDQGDGCECSPQPCQQQAGVCQGAHYDCGQSQDGLCDTATLLDHARLQGARHQPGEETLCDGADNNCDGQIDELCCQAQQRPSSHGLPEGGALPGRSLHLAASPQGQRYAAVFFHPEAQQLQVLLLDGQGQQLGPRSALGPSWPAPVHVQWHQGQFEIFWLEQDQLFWRTLDSQGQLQRDAQQITLPRAPEPEAPFWIARPADGALHLLLPEPDGATVYRFWERQLQGQYTFSYPEGLRAPEPRQFFPQGDLLVFGVWGELPGEGPEEAPLTSVLFTLRSDERGLRQPQEIRASRQALALPGPQEDTLLWLRLQEGAPSTLEQVTLNAALEPIGEPEPLLSLSLPELRLDAVVGLSQGGVAALLERSIQGQAPRWLLWRSDQGNAQEVWRAWLQQPRLAEHRWGLALFALEEDALAWRRLGPSLTPLCP